MSYHDDIGSPQAGFLPVDSEERASNELSQLFDWASHHLSHNNADPARVLSILQRHPRLAHKEFKISDRDRRHLTPLHCILSSSKAPSLAQVKAIHKMNRTAVHERQGRSNNTALHLVCGGRGHDPAVVEYIFSQHPTALTTKNRDGKTPIGLLLQVLKYRRDNLPIFRRLLELCPGCLEEYFVNRDPFESALRLLCSTEVLECIATRHTCEDLDLSNAGRFLTPKETEIVCTMMPRLKHLICAPVFYRSNAMKNLLDCAANNTSLQSFTLHWFPSDATWSDLTETCNSLKLLLSRIKSLKFLKIAFCGQPNQRRIVVSSHQQRPRTPALEPTGLSSRDTQDRLQKLFLCNLLCGLTSNQGVEEMVLHGLNLTSFEGGESLKKSAEDLRGKTTSIRPQSGLLKLRFESCRGEDPLSCMPELLSLLPSVTELSIEGVVLLHSTGPCTTESLVEIINEDQLQSLCVRRCTFDLGRICKSLCWSKNLKHLVLQSVSTKPIEHQDDLLGVLEDTNTTLEKVDVFPYAPNNRLPKEWTEKKAKIYHYLNLNKYGRRLARNPESSREAFVESLRRLEKEDQQKLNDRNKQMIRYELLRQAPGIWVGSND